MLSSGVLLCIKFHDNISNHFQVTECTNVYVGNHLFIVQRVIAAEIEIVTVFLCSARGFNMFHEVSQRLSRNSRHEYLTGITIFNV